MLNRRFSIPVPVERGSPERGAFQIFNGGRRKCPQKISLQSFLPSLYLHFHRSHRTSPPSVESRSAFSPFGFARLQKKSLMQSIA